MYSAPEQIFISLEMTESKYFFWGDMTTDGKRVLYEFDPAFTPMRVIDLVRGRDVQPRCLTASDLPCVEA